MMPLVVLIALGVYAILGVVLWIAIILRGLSKRGHLQGMPTNNHPIHVGKWPQTGSFAVWEWRDGHWRLVAGSFPAGSDPGPPPGYPGAIEGEIIKTWFRTQQP